MNNKGCKWSDVKSQKNEYDPKGVESHPLHWGFALFDDCSSPAPYLYDTGGDEIKFGEPKLPEHWDLTCRTVVPPQRPLPEQPENRPRIGEGRFANRRFVIEPTNGVTGV